LRKIEGEEISFTGIGSTQETNYTDHNVDSDKNYLYKIEAERNSDIFTSNEGLALAAYCEPVLSPPTTSCQADGPRVHLTWSSISGTLSTYEVYRDGVKIGSTINTTYDDGPNIAGTVSYDYFIRAIWQDGTPNDSDTASIKAPACPPTLNASTNCINDTAPGGPQINLFWNALLGVQNYQIYRKAPGEASFSLLTTINETSFDDNLVESLSTGYYQGGVISYYVKATWETDQKDSSVSSVNIPRCAPFLTVSSNCDEDFNMVLSWTATMNATHYNIYRDGEFIHQATGITNNSYTDFMNLVICPDKICTHTYHVDAIGIGSLPSNPVTKDIDCTTVEPPTPPPVLDPLSVFCENGDSVIGISWSPSDNVSYYTLFRNGVDIGKLIETFYNDRAIESGYEYTYHVVAYGHMGSETYSENTQTVTAVDCIPPSSPVLNLTIGCQLGEPFVDLSWTDTTNTYSYDIYRGPSLADLSLLNHFDQGSPEFTSRTWKDTGVLTSTSYYYQIIANGPPQVPSSSSNIGAITTSSCLPTTPWLYLSKFCQSGNPVVRVSWSTDEANTTRYEIFRQDYSTTEPIQREYDVAIKIWKDEGVSPNTTYNYKVEAVGYEESIRSTQGYKSISTGDCVPPGPFTLSEPTVNCQGSYPQADLSWTNSYNATFYELYRNLLYPGDTIAETLNFPNVTSPFTDFGSGYALSFDGNDYARVLNDASLNPTNELSVETWVRADRLPYHSSNQHYILAKLDYPEFGWWLYFENYGRIRFNMRDGIGGGQTVRSDYLNTGKWYHVVATVVDRSDMKLYINGSLVHTRSNTILTAANTSSFRINNSGPNYSLDGIIDEVRVYNRELTAPEVFDHYNGVFNDGRDLVGWWHLSEGTGQNIYDGSIHGNNGTRGSNTNVETSDPTWVHGGPVSGSRYNWQAKATGPGGSTFSNTTTPTVMPMCPPTKPGLVLDGICENSNPGVKVSWTFSVHAVKYEIYREGASNPIKIITSSDPEFSSRSWIDNNQGLGLPPSTPYSYWVKAIGSDPPGFITESNHVDITTPRCITPSQPQNLSALFDCNGPYPQVKLTWEDSTDTSYYRVYRTDGPSFGPIDDDDSFTYTYIDAYPSVEVGTPYSYSVTAYGPAGESTPSEPININTGYCSFTKPSIGLSTDCENLEPINKISWTDPTPFNTASYEVYRDSIIGPPIKIITPDMSEFSSRTWKDNLSLSPLTPYTYWVKTIGYQPLGASISDPKTIETYSCGVFLDAPSLSGNADCCAYWPCNKLNWPAVNNAYSYNVFRTNPDTTVSTYSSRISPFSDRGNFVLDFDGIDDYINVGDINSNDWTAITIEAWIYHRDTGDDRVVCKSTGTEVSNHIFSLGVPGNLIRVRLATDGDGGNTDTHDSNSNVLIPNTWQHVAFTWDNFDPFIRYYVDGQELSNTDFHDGDTIRDSSQVVIIGNVNLTADPGRFFNGMMDEVRIYNRALSAQEIQNHYQGIYENEARLKGVWHFDEGEGPIVFDDSGEGHHGKAKGPLWVSGKINNALEFDGYRDYVDYGNSTILQPIGNMSLEFWAKPFNIAYARQNILCKAYGGEFCLTMEKNGSLSYYHGSCGGMCWPYMSFGAGNMFSDNTWVHVVITRDTTTRTMRSYKNGTFFRSTTWTSDKDPRVSSYSLKCGAGYVNRFKGIIDEVRIYERVLNDTEISEHYSGSFANESGLLGLWHFDEEKGGIALDDSGYGNDGTLFRGEPDWINPSGAPTYIPALDKTELYKYRVRTIGADTMSNPSNEVSIYASDCLPAKPDLIVNPSCTGQNPQLALSWDLDPLDLTEYWSVWKQRAGDPASLEHLLDIAPPTTSYTDGIVESDIEYEYYLVAFGGGESVYSDVISETAPSCLDAPAKPIITVTPQCYSYSPRMNIGWQSDPTGNTISYNIWRRNTTLGETTSTEIYTGLEASITEYSDDVFAENSYIYMVEAVGSGEGNNVFSDPSTEETALSCGDLPPLPPQLFFDFYISTGDMVADSIYWTDSGPEESYKLFRCDDPPCGLTDWIEIATLPAEATTTATIHYTDYSVVDDHTYGYQVFAYNINAPEGVASNIISFHIPTAVPGNFTLSGSWIGGATFKLTWTEAATTLAGGPVTYDILRDDSEDFSSTDICTVFCTTYPCDQALECFDSSPSISEVYYKAKASNLGGFTESNIIRRPPNLPTLWREIVPW
jgi:hypothetical protein